MEGSPNLKVCNEQLGLHKLPNLRGVWTAHP